ncbi:MAG: hypothetical protein R3F19_08655 [Verrucomicrobiales bacterium]
MWNIIIGLVFVVGGLSGKMVLIGTNSSPALAVVGGLMLIWGIVQMVRSKKGA